MKSILLLLSCLSLASCATGYNPRFYYNNIEVVNLTGGTITNEEVIIGETARNLRCDAVTKNRLCQERFGGRPYPGQAIQLSWQDSAGNPQSRQPNPSIPATLSPGLSLRVMLEIHEDGSVKAGFKQEDFRRH
jgi:hypothetical protein